MFTLSVFSFFNRCQDTEALASRDFRWLIFLPEVHDQQIIYSLDSLIFIGKPLDTILLAGQADYIPKLEHQTYLKSRLLEAFTLAGKENMELYEQVTTHTTESAHIQFVCDYTLEYYNSRFNPGACDFQKIKLLLENVSHPHFRAQEMNLKAYWFKDIKFDLDFSRHW
jgi:hypothetical protein